VYAAFLAREIGARTAYVPDDSGVFSALGMLTTDLVFHEERSMLRRPPLDADGIGAINALYADLEARVLASFSREGFEAGRVRLERAVDMRFSMQVHELDVEMPRRTIDARDVDVAIGAFVEKYEQTYGKNSAFTAAGVEMVTFRAVGTVGLERPPLETADVEGQGESSRLGSRPAYFASVGDFVAADIHAGDRVMPGASFHGPVIIQRMGDTVVIPPGAQARMDRRRNLIIEWRDRRDA
jgi:N-methylhydantoinase A